jgi:hypothetical protein
LVSSCLNLASETERKKRKKKRNGELERRRKERWEFPNSILLVREQTQALGVLVQVSGCLKQLVNGGNNLVHPRQLRRNGGVSVIREQEEGEKKEGACAREINLEDESLRWWLRLGEMYG